MENFTFGKKLKLLVITSQGTAVAYHRLMIPNMALKKMFGDDISVHYSADFMSIFEPFFYENIDVIIISRLVEIKEIEIRGKIYSAEQLLTALKRKGKKIIIDIDDYWNLDRTHILKGKDSVEFKDQTKMSLRIADAVFTTNKRLLKMIRPFNKRVHIMSNAIDKTEEVWQPCDSGYEFIFGYVGGFSHMLDIQYMKTSFRDTDSVVYNKLYIDYFSEVKAGKDIFRYGYLFDDFLVSLSPLVPNKFNALKSNLKVIEAAAKGRAVVVTKTPPYTDWLPESVIAIEPNQSWEFIKKISPVEWTQRAEHLKNAYDERYDLDLLSQKRMKIYKS